MSGAWDEVADAFGFGGGDDHGSSNWAAWGHEEIRWMLDNSVEPGDIGDAAAAWRALGRDAEALVAGLTRDLDAIVSGGWRGASADAALTALAPINRWSVGIADTAEQTTRLMDDSASSVAQAKAAVPPPKSMNWREVLSLAGPSTGGLSSPVVDAVAQEQARSEAHAEAVRIMTDTYSAPINDHRAAVPAYPQLADPTMQPPEPVPSAGVAPGYAEGGVPDAGSGAPGGAHVAHTLSAPTALQGMAGDPAGPAPYGGGQMAPDQATRGAQHAGGQVAAAAAAVAGVPIMAPLVEGGARRVAGGAGRLGAGRAAGYPSGAEPSSGGVHPSGGGRAGAGNFGPRPTAHPGEFGPRPSAHLADLSSRPSGSVEAAEERVGGLGRGGGAGAAGRLGAGDVMTPVGATGNRGEDSEHRRPSYLVEMNDIFSDGRKVAPAVIGEDAPEQGR
jgi:hypothetical protein